MERVSSSLRGLAMMGGTYPIDCDNERPAPYALKPIPILLRNTA
jgi:hypothetical protein